MDMQDTLDIAAYFDRIGYQGALDSSPETLKQLHFLHPLSIPFENLNPLLRIQVSLDLKSLQTKLIQNRRGGYCYEQNLLFMQVLQALGFEVSGLAARVMWNKPEGAMLQRTHMLLKVEMPDGPWIADVGFGGITLTSPLRLISGLEQKTPHEPFKLEDNGNYWVLSIRIGDEWRPVYQFGLDPYNFIDYQIANYYVSSHPDSQFVHSLMVARPTLDGRYIIHNNHLIRHKNGTEKRTLSSADEIKQALRDIFGIDVPAGLADALQREKLLG